MNISKIHIDLIEKILSSGDFKSRSEFIRRILDMYLHDYYRMIKVFEILTPEQLKLLGD